MHPVSEGSSQNVVGRRFLEYFPENRRSGIANNFLWPIRNNGLSTERAVCSSVLREYRRRLTRYRWRGRTEDRSFYEEVVRRLCEDPEAALDYARHCLAYEALPAADKARLKEQKADQGRHRWMETQPATPRQLDYLRALGYEGTPENRAAASDLIDQLQSGKGGGS